MTAYQVRVTLDKDIKQAIKHKAIETGEKEKDLMGRLLKEAYLQEFGKAINATSA